MFQNRLPWAALVAGLLVAQVPAQTAGLVGDRSLTNYAFSLEGTVFGPCIHGDFDGDSALDAAMIVDGKVDIFRYPGLYESHWEDLANAITIDIFPKVDGSTPDSIALVSASGLYRLDWQESLEDFVKSSLLVPELAGAQHLRGYITSDGDVALIAVMGNGTTVRRATQVEEEWSTMDLFELSGSEPVLDVVLFEYDGAGYGPSGPGPEPELAVMTQHSLQVFSLGGGAPLEDCQAPTCESEGLAAVRHAGEIYEGVAWVVTGPNGSTQFLTTVGLGHMVTINLAARDIVAIASGDHDGDGLDDLLAIPANEENFFLFTNLGDSTGPVFATGPAGLSVMEIGAPILPGGPSHARPALFDIDNDGDGDFVAVLPGNDAFQINRNAEEDEALQTPHMEQAAPPVQINGNLELTFELEGPYENPAGATHIEIKAWELTVDGGLTPQSFDTQFIPIGLFPEPVSPNSPVRMSIAVPLVQSPPLDHHVLFVWTLRCITSDSDDPADANVSKVYPGTVYVAHTAEDTEPEYDLVQNVSSEPAYPVLLATGVRNPFDEEIEEGEKETPCVPCNKNENTK